VSSNGRDERGHFLPGRSPNPGGLSKRFHELKRRAAEYTEEALEAIAEIARNSKSDMVRLAAWRELLDRGHGKPAQEILIDKALATKKWSELSDNELLEVMRRYDELEGAPKPN
jgi:hypothetical protein